MYRTRQYYRVSAPSDWCDETRVRNGQEFHKPFENVGRHRPDSTAVDIQVLGNILFFGVTRPGLWEIIDRRRPRPATTETNVLLSAIRAKVCTTYFTTIFPVRSTFVCRYSQVASRAEP